MSNQNQNPIRVADLNQTIHVPPAPATPISKAYVAAKNAKAGKSSRTRHSKVLDEPESQYAWNKQPEPSVENVNSTIAENEVAETPLIHDSQIHGSRGSQELMEPQELKAAPSTERFPYNAPMATPPSPASERFTSVPSDDVAANNELAEIRARFAGESGQNAAELTPITIEDIYSAAESNSAESDFFSEVLASPIDLTAPRTSRVWGIDYHCVDMDQALDYLEQVIHRRQPSYAITANLNYSMLCYKNPRLAQFTQGSALTLCDGMPALWRSKLNANKLPERVAGSDLIYRLTERCANQKLRVYFYGASEGVAEKTASVLKELYPKLIVAGVQCPPFRACSSEEVRAQVARIKQTRPDLLFVALGQPKGEYWIEDHLAALEVPLTIQVGASFDFVAGNSIRAPKLMQSAGLEWLYRTFKDPMRLAPRYFNNFVYLVKALRRELIEKLS